MSNNEIAIIKTAISDLPTEMNVIMKNNLYNSATGVYEEVVIKTKISILNQNGNALPIEAGNVVMEANTNFSVMFTPPDISVSDQEFRPYIGAAVKVLTKFNVNEKNQPILDNGWMSNTLMLEREENTVMNSNPREYNFRVESSSQAMAEGKAVNSYTCFFVVAIWAMVKRAKPKAVPVTYRGGGLRSIGGGGATRSITRGGSNYTDNTEDGFLTDGAPDTKEYNDSDFKPVDGTRVNRCFKVLVAKKDEDVFEKALQVFRPEEEKGYEFP